MVTANGWWTEDQPVFGAVEVWNAVSLMREIGYDTSARLGAGPTDRGALLDTAYRLSLRQQIELHRALDWASHPNLPLQLAKRLHLWTFGESGFAVMSSATLGDGLRTILRFAPLLNMKFPLRMTYGDRVTLILEGDPTIEAQIERQLFALDVAKIVTFLKDLAGADVRPLRLATSGLEAQAQVSIAQYAGATPAPCEGRLRARIELDAGLMSRPLAQSHPWSHARSMADCDRIVADLRARTDAKAAILARLRRLEEHVPTFAELAEELRISERTLRRKLEKAGTSYSRLLDELREDLALRHLSRPGHTTEQVAELLGYADATSFRHAFKRWTGRPPRAFRGAEAEGPLATTG